MTITNMADLEKDGTSGKATAFRFFGRWNSERVVIALTIILLLLLIAYPLALLLIGSFRTDLPMMPGTFTLANFRNLVEDSDNRRAILNTVISSGLAMIMATVMGCGLAWITSRTNTPGRRLFDNLFVIPFYLSPFIGAIAWTMLANPRIGFINKLFMNSFGFAHAPFNIYTLGGLTFVMALYNSPIVFLFVAGALRSMNPALEEASRIHGVGAFGTMFKVTLPIVAPAITSSALLVFLSSAGDFGIPAVIGIPMNFNVITTRIWVELGYYPPKHTEAAAFSVVLWIVSAILVFAQHRILARKSFATVTGRGFRPSRIELGWTRYIALAICILYFALSIVLPYGALAYASIHPYLSFAFDPKSWTLSNYWKVLFDDSVSVRAIWNTFILAIGGATITIFLSLVVSYIVIRSRVPGRSLVHFLALLPICVPGVVFGVALLWGYIFLPIPIYGTMWMLLIAYISHYITYGVRATSSGFAQISVELEECSRIHGANWLLTMRRVVVPLLRQAMVVGWILLFAEFVRALSLSVLLYTNSSVVLPVVTFELFETGAYPQLAALSIVQTVLVFAAIYAAKKIARVDSFMDVRA